MQQRDGEMENWKILETEKNAIAAHQRSPEYLQFWEIRLCLYLENR